MSGLKRTNVRYKRTSRKYRFQYTGSRKTKKTTINCNEELKTVFVKNQTYAFTSGPMYDQNGSFSILNFNTIDTPNLSSVFQNKPFNLH